VSSGDTNFSCFSNDNPFIFTVHYLVDNCIEYYLFYILFQCQYHYKINFEKYTLVPCNYYEKYVLQILFLCKLIVNYSLCVTDTKWVDFYRGYIFKTNKINHKCIFFWPINYIITNIIYRLNCHGILSGITVVYWYNV